MEETPEEVLARLQRYVDSMKSRGEFAPATSAVPVPSSAEPRPVVGAAVLTAEPADVPLKLSTVSRAIAGQAICAATCIFTILLWINVTRLVVYIVALAAAALFGLGLARRIRFAGWGLIGLVLGLVIGRFS